jgi:hypothetical protein
MNTILKLAAIAGGGFLVYEWFLKPASAAAASSPTSTTGGSTSTAVASTTMTMVASAAQKAGYNPTAQSLTADEWNYFLQQVRGIPGPDPSIAWPAQDRNFKMTINEWWAGVSANGVSGLGNYAFTRFMQ